jgi:ribosomal protein S6--L-glutamate ligase
MRIGGMPSGSRIAIILGDETADRDIQLLTRVIRARGHVPVTIPWHVLSVAVDAGGPHLCYRGRQVDVDGIVHRLSTGARDGLALLAAIEGATPFLNPVESVLCAASRFATAIRLVESGVPTPEAALVSDDRELLVFARKYGYPVVLRRPDAACGSEVVLADDEDELAAKAAELREPGAPVLVQRFVAGMNAGERCVVVVGGRFVTAFPRLARAGGRGAQGEALPVLPDEREIEIAERAAKATGLDLAGVDVLPGPEGPMVVGVRAFPELGCGVGHGAGPDSGPESGPGLGEAAGAAVYERVVELVEQRILAGSAQRAMVSALADGHPSTLPTKLPSINTGATVRLAGAAEKA